MYPYNFAPPYDNTQVTVELRELVKSGIDIWAFDYPSYYKGEQKAAFEQKVLDHYWLRQIGMETPGRWLHYFRTRIREIMPYYIQLYESEALMKSIEDPFGNVDITETFEEERTGATTGSSETQNTGTSTGSGTETRTNQTDQTSEMLNNNVKKFSNTPQGNINNLDNYLTEATVDNGGSTTTDEMSELTNLTKSDEASTEATSTSTAEGTERSTAKTTFTKKGNQGVNTYAHDMKELRETFLNIDLRIINELKDLFLQVY